MVQSPPNPTHPLANSDHPPSPPSQHPSIVHPLSSTSQPSPNTAPNAQPPPYSPRPPSGMPPTSAVLAHTSLPRPPSSMGSPTTYTTALPFTPPAIRPMYTYPGTPPRYVNPRLHSPPIHARCPLPNLSSSTHNTNMVINHPMATSTSQATKAPITSVYAENNSHNDSIRLRARTMPAGSYTE